MSWLQQVTIFCNFWLFQLWWQWRLLWGTMDLSICIQTQTIKISVYWMLRHNDVLFKPQLGDFATMLNNQKIFSSIHFVGTSIYRYKITNHRKSSSYFLYNISYTSYLSCVIFSFVITPILYSVYPLSVVWETLQTIHNRLVVLII